MSANTDLPERYFISMDRDYQVQQQYRYQNNKLLTRLVISSPAIKLSTQSSWLPYPLTGKDWLAALTKAAPTVKTHLPLLETFSQHHGRQLICSSFLLKNGQLFKLYLPQDQTWNMLKQARLRNDQLSLSNGEHVYKVPSFSVVAVLDE